MKINEYLDAVKAALRCSTDSELALRLRVQPGRISNYRTGRSLPDIQMAQLIAALLDMRSGTVIGDIREESALAVRRIAAKAHWREMNHRLVPSLLAKVAAAMRRDLDYAFAPLTRRERLIELLAVAVIIYLTIVMMAL